MNKLKIKYMAYMYLVLIIILSVGWFLGKSLVEPMSIEMALQTGLAVVVRSAPVIALILFLQYMTDRD